MKRFIIASLFLLVCGALGAQAQPKIPVDYDAIRRTVEERPRYYNSLVERFVTADTTLCIRELSILYYSLFFLDVEHGQGAIDYDIYCLRNEGKYEEAYLMGEEALARTPTSMVLLSCHLSSLYHIDRPAEEVDRYIWRYRAMLRAIKASGDGRSEATAFKVLEATSESVLIRDLFDGYPRKFEYKTDWDKRITRYKVSPSAGYPHKVLYIDFNSRGRY